MRWRRGGGRGMRSFTRWCFMGRLIWWGGLSCCSMLCSEILRERFLSSWFLCREDSLARISQSLPMRRRLAGLFKVEQPFSKRKQSRRLLRQMPRTFAPKRDLNRPSRPPLVRPPLKCARSRCSGFQRRGRTMGGCLVTAVFDPEAQTGGRATMRWKVPGI